MLFVPVNTPTPLNLIEKHTRVEQRLQTHTPTYFLYIYTTRKEEKINGVCVCSLRSPLCWHGFSRIENIRVCFLNWI